MSPAERLNLLPEAERKKYLSQFSKKELAALEYHWPFWARPKQLMPAGEYNVWLLLAGRGFGKDVSVHTEIPTTTGWKKMKDLEVGDTVFDEKGIPTRITYTSPVYIGKKCYDVVFDDGSVVTASFEHEWLTWTRAARKSHGRASRPTIHPSVVSTEEIARTLKVQNGRETNHSIAVAGSLQLPKVDLPVDPYVLGVWLGDGTSAAAEITSADEEMVELLQAAGCEVSPPRINHIGGKAHRYSVYAHRHDQKLRTALRLNGLLGSKHIPASYLRASEEQRLALLQGLMDTDGYCEPDIGNVEFCNTNKALAEGVFELAVSLGLKPVLHESRAMLYGEDCGPKYRVHFTPNRPVFRLRRKLERQRFDKAQKNRTTHRYIVDVRERESVPTRCISVEAESHLFLCGRAMIPTHNTRTGAETIRMLVEQKRAGRIALIAPTAADTRDVIVEGPSGICNVFPPDRRPRYEPSKRRVSFHNGALAFLYSADEPERLRGVQHDLAYCDELCSWRDPNAWDMMQFGLRLGKRPLCIVTTTPKSVPLVRQLVKDSRGPNAKVFLTTGNTYENRTNLAANFFDVMLSKYEGTRLGQQEIYAQILEDVEGALWNSKLLEETRVPKTEAPEFKRIVIAIDPATSNKSTSDETGIVVAGLGSTNHAYVLDDLSGRMSPNDWARKAVAAFDRYNADRVVVETNQGGDMIEEALRTVRKNLPIKQIKASKGKHTRAEPIAALYEQGRAHHLGYFPLLEEEMCQWDPIHSDYSPDRMDALVWAMTELMFNGGPRRILTNLPVF